MASSILNHFTNVSQEIPPKVTIIAVSKRKPIESIEILYRAGQHEFGENKVQELVEKHHRLPKDIHWHMIGHLQRNKVKYIAPFVSLIHSVDTIKLLKEIEKQALKHNRSIDCLLQIHIAKEETKFGLDTEEAETILEHFSSKHIRIRGLMGMATNTTDSEIVKNEFCILRDFFNLWQKKKSNFDILSMGMSNDYLLAIECGSNMVRLGRCVFGPR